MEPALYILAFAGISALLIRLGGAIFRLIQRSGEAWIARTAARSRESRGDLTGFDEAESLERRARRARTLAVVNVVVCLLLLVVPVFTPWTVEIYAACSLLWLFTVRVRRGTAVDVRRPGP